MSDIVRDADECAKAIERALAAMEPPLEVYEGMVKIIVAFVPYGEFVARTSAACWCSMVRVVISARFDTGAGIEWFDISDDGLTARRTRKDPPFYRFVCASPSFSEGDEKIRTFPVVSPSECHSQMLRPAP